MVPQGHLGSLCVCKRNLRSTVAFSVYGTVGLFPGATKDWGPKSNFVPGENNVKENPMVDINKVLLSPLDIKLELMRNLWEGRGQKMVLPSETCALYFQVSVLLRSRKTSSSDQRSEKC